MTFAELVAAMQAREGLLVKLTREDRTLRKGRRRTVQGVVKPGLDDRTSLAPEEDGRLIFGLAPAQGYVLDPRVVTTATEEPDARRLRVEMGNTTWVIETLADQRRR
jgi:hypothetical protein